MIDITETRRVLTCRPVPLEHTCRACSGDLGIPFQFDLVIGQEPGYTTHTVLCGGCAATLAMTIAQSVRDATRTQENGDFEKGNTGTVGEPAHSSTTLHTPEVRRTRLGDPSVGR